MASLLQHDVSLDVADGVMSNRDGRSQPSGHVRSSPIATENQRLAACREVPLTTPARPNAPQQWNLIPLFSCLIAAGDECNAGCFLQFATRNNTSLALLALDNIGPVYLSATEATVLTIFDGLGAGAAGRLLGAEARQVRVPARRGCEGGTTPAR